MNKSAFTRPFTRLLVIALLSAFPGCGREPPPAQPELSPVIRRDITVSTSAAGMVEPVTTIEVKSKASGEIVAVMVEEGDVVRGGQLLVRVDPRIPLNGVVQAEADSQVARAELDNAEAQLARAESLRETKAITDIEYEQARLARASANAALIRARRALEDAKIAYEDTEVRAPVAGVVLGRSVAVGTVIASASRDVGGGAILLRMASLDTVQVRALVDETDIGMIQPGMPVTMRVEAYPNRPFEGRVLRIGAEATVLQNVTMFPVLVRILNRERLLRPGMNAEVQVHVGEVRNALAVPNAALRPPKELELAAASLGLSMDDVNRQLGQSSAGDSRGNAQGDDRNGGDHDGGRGRGGRGGRGSDNDEGSEADRAASLFGGNYVVFALRGGAPRAVAVRTGLTDFDYTAVLDGLAETDTVLLLPTAGLMEERQERSERARERAGSPLGEGNRGGRGGGGR